MKKCVKCETELKDEDIFCPKCGVKQPAASDFGPGGAPEVEPEPAPEVEVEPEVSYRERDKNYYTNGKVDYDSLPMWEDRPAFYLWIISLALSLVFGGTPGLVLAIVAIIKSRNSKNKTFSKVALAVSIVSLVVSLVLIIVYSLMIAGIISWGLLRRVLLLRKP